MNDIIKRAACEHALRRIARGDTDGLETVYNHMGKQIYLLAYSILGDTHAAEDVLQDTLLRLSKRAAMREDGNAVAYILTVSRNLALDRVRAGKAKKRGVSESLDELEAVIGEGRLTEELEAKEIGEEIGRFLQKENEKARKIFVRRYFLCEEISEIAGRYRMSEGSISASLFRTRLRLKEHLERAGIII